jgi:hypothetical protein
MFYNKNLRNETLSEIKNRFSSDPIAELLLALIEFIPEDDEVSIFVPRRTAEELTQYKDCYAPLLREVAQLCNGAVYGY